MPPSGEVNSPLQVQADPLPNVIKPCFLNKVFADLLTRLRAGAAPAWRDRPLPQGGEGRVSVNFGCGAAALHHAAGVTSWLGRVVGRPRA